MKHLLLSLLIFGFGISGSLGQTIKTLGYNTTNGQVVANTAELTFTNETVFNGLRLNTASGYIFIPDNDGQKDIFFFDGGSDAPVARANLGFSTNLNTLWTATNASNARSAVGLGATNGVTFNTLHADLDGNAGSGYTLTLGNTNTGFRGVGSSPGNLPDDFVYARSGVNMFGFYSNSIQSMVPHSFLKSLTLVYGLGNTAVLEFSGVDAATGAAISRTNLGLGATWLTNTNVTNFRTAIGLGETNSATFQSLSIAGASQSSAINLGNSVAMFTSTNNQDGVTFTFTGGERAYLGFDGLILYQNGGNLAFGAGNTSGAAISRTNLGLGGGITTNRTFVSYNGTNYTTNTVTISNGIITGWTQ